jgi:hypothetical protein
MKINRSGNGFNKPINKGLKQGLKLILFTHMIICLPHFSNHWFLHFLIHKILVCPPIYFISLSLNLYLKPINHFLYFAHFFCPILNILTIFSGCQTFLSAALTFNLSFRNEGYQEVKCYNLINYLSIYLL